MGTPRKSLGQVLVERGVISETDLRTAMDVCKQTTGTRLEQVLVDMEIADEDAVLDAKAQTIGVERVKISQTQIDPQAVRAVPAHLLNKHNILPIRREGSTLVVAMEDPTDIIALDDLRMMGVQVKPVVASKQEIESALARVVSGVAGPEQAQAQQQANPFAGGQEFGGEGDFMQGALDQIEEQRGGLEQDLDSEQDLDNVTAMVEAAPIIRIVNTIIIKAVQDGASDIHVEPQRRNVRIRYRVDGVLHEMMSVPKYVHPPLLSRIKIMSEMDIAERRKPQDGRIPLRHQGKDYDLRVSVIPTVNGEKAVMRILDKSSVLLGLSKLGMFPDTQAEVETLIAQPYGILLSCGPTGSGKTTTQYSVLNKLNSVGVNIITIEDPVEYQLPGISQVMVNRKADVGFGNALRHFLRQDPDIIMVSEIRDLETAEAAIEASLTGHLVLSTVHTNDAPSSVTRLIDIGIEPFLVGASLIGALAQRLVRKICSNCKVAYHPPADSLERFGFRADPNNPITFYRGQGCSNCRDTGYKGRSGIYELMQISAEISELIVRGASVQELKEACVANGMRTLQQDGLKKVLEGITTIEEVMRVVQSIGGSAEL
ncbi:MAG: Flp pilus assembly complex ATPase component TadA [Armatimonadetes bacterium]|nr:Flp pilus assembly complex ATPase component TadA [Armatimonadota bacterium]